MGAVRSLPSKTLHHTIIIYQALLVLGGLQVKRGPSPVAFTTRQHDHRSLVELEVPWPPSTRQKLHGSCGSVSEGCGEGGTQGGPWGVRGVTAHMQRD